MINRFSLAVALPLLLCSCEAMRQAHDPNDMFTEPAAVKASTASMQADEKKDPAHELAMAELELQKARLDSRKKMASARLAAQLAEHKLKEARVALTVFKELQKSLRKDEGKLALDRATGQAEDAAAELAELEAMYSGEEGYAASTKEIVLSRGRRNLEHARRALQLQEQKLEKLLQEDLPLEERKLENARVEAEGKLAEAAKALEIAELEGKVALLKAEKKLEKAREKKEAKP